MDSSMESILMVSEKKFFSSLHNSTRGMGDFLGGATTRTHWNIHAQGKEAYA